MADPNDLRRRQLLREAEGYLDLLMVFADQWSPRKESRDCLAVRALDVLNRLQDFESGNGHSDYLRGQALRVMERYLEALDHLRKAAKHDPRNIHIHLALGWCYKRIGRLDLAIQSLEDGLDIDSKQGIIQYNLACYWSLASNVRLALEYLARSIELDPAYRDLVDEETDFDPIRDDPGFVALTNFSI